MDVVIALKIVLLLVVLLPEAVRSQQFIDELVECYTSRDCSSGPTTPLLITRTQCCVNTPEAVGFKVEGSEACNFCLVFGFFQSTFTALERGESYSMSVGFKKGRTEAPAGLPFSVMVEFGTATSRDFTLQRTTVNVLTSNMDPEVVSFILRPDGITQELNETLKLRLAVTNPSLLALYNFNNNAFFLDVLDMVIIDDDVLEIMFDNDDYGASESELSIPVRVTKNQRIATPVTIRVTPVTLAQHRSTGRPDPPGIPPDNQFSPIEASSQDFDSTPITATFQPDESGARVDSVVVSVPIVDDDINEAPEQDFVVTLTVETATDPNNIRVTGQDSLCRIRDNDDIRIGFERPSYTFSEPEFDEDIIDDVFIAKENGVISEQTFRIVITTTGNTPNQNIRAADHSTDTRDNDYMITRVIQGGVIFIVDELEPQQQKIPFNFRLYGDDIAEGTEAFRAFVSPVENSPGYLDPMVLSVDTFIVIEDDDNVKIGFQRNYTVNETVGAVQVCTVVHSPSPSVPILSRIILGINTVAGTAGETDYARIAASDGLVVLRYDNNTRRSCFDLTITNDGIIETTERFTVHLVLSPLESPPVPVLLNPNETTIEILGDADVTVGFVLTDLKVMENGNIVVLSVGVLEGQLTREVELSFSTSSRTAQSGSDYEQVSGRLLTFGPGSTSLDVSVNIINDEIFEVTELFSALLTLPSTPADRVAVHPALAEVSILDDDSLTIGFNPATYSVNENEGPVNLNINLLSGSIGQLGINNLVSTREGTAVESDFTSLQRRSVQLTNDQLTGTIAINIVNDSITENDEQFSAELVDIGVFSASGDLISLTDQVRNRLILQPSLADVTILDEDEAVIGFLQTEYEVGEGDGNVTFLIGVRSGELSFDVPVIFQTADGSAVDGDDYSALSEDLIFFGTQARDVSVDIVDDDILEAVESFFGQLSVSGTLPPRVRLDPVSATVTIMDGNFSSTDATTSSQDGGAGSSNNNVIFIIVGVVVTILIIAVAVVIIIITVTVLCLKQQQRNRQKNKSPVTSTVVPKTITPSDQVGVLFDDVHVYEEMKGLYGDYTTAQPAYDNMATNSSHEQVLVQNIAYGQLNLHPSEKETTNRELSEYYVVPDP